MLHQRLTAAAELPCPLSVSVTFHTPFATGYLDEKRMTALPRERWNDVVRYLSAATSGAIWEPATQLPLNLQGYEDTLLDDLMREMPRPVLRAIPRQVDDSWHTGPTDALRWRPTQADLTIWNVGAALLVETFELQLPPKTEWTKVAEAATRHRAAMTAARELWVHESLVAFAMYARRYEYVDDWADPPPAERFWSTSLWTYESLTVRVADEWSVEQLERAAHELVDDGETRKETSASGESALRIGLTAAVLPAASTLLPNGCGTCSTLIQLAGAGP